MVTRLKTVEYWFPMIATLADNTATDATQITITLPDTPTTFVSCFVEAIIADANTTLANVTVRNLQFRLGAAGFTSVNNTTTLGNGGENFTFHHSGDFTSHFTSNWTGTSMTADCRLTVNTGGAGCRNASVKVSITYEFDDSATTQVKTVWIPLNAPQGAPPTSKSTVYDTIPALDTYLPEASKTYYQITAVVQGCTEAASTTDISISMAVDSVNDFTSQLYEKGTNVDNWYRVNADYTAMDTSATASFRLWSSSASDFNHPQAWLVVTYGFNASTTTSIMNSLILPMEVDSPMGGPTSSDYQRAEREVWVQEQNPSLDRLAFYCFYDKNAAIGGLNARVGTGTFITYTDVAAVLGGGSGLMIRNDSAFSISRGRNTISMDIYNTDNTDLGYNVSGFWILNYTSDVPSQGIWAANHSVRSCYKPVGTAAAAAQSIVTNTSFVIPEADRFLTSIGLNYVYTSNATGNASGVHVGVERLVGEGGLIWESIYSDIGGSDPETGIRQCWSTARSVFGRWRETSTNDIVDPGGNRLDITTARRIRLALALGCASFDHLDLYITYHSITYTVSGSITGVNTAGGDVEVNLHRAATGEIVFTMNKAPASSTLAYTFVWFDNTEDMYVTAYQDNTRVGRSGTGVAT
jgi:hypothetical protein